MRHTRPKKHLFRIGIASILIRTFCNDVNFTENIFGIHKETPKHSLTTRQGLYVTDTE